ncbi:MAG: HU family DNA-binding protein, partial [Methylophilus sp.]|uniref:HU family DNA-binding protein n=1 Tax=Methylophilus sp. TaxID=29541 RepID=UPI0040372501
MNKSELIDHIANAAGISKAAAARALDATTEAISGALKKGELVTLIGCGTFYVGERSARSGRKPGNDPVPQAPANQQVPQAPANP